MSLGDVLAEVGRRYPLARTEPFTSHPVLGLVRRETTAAVRDALAGFERKTYVRGSVGPSRWATIPWVAIFDGHVTRSARRGFYVVYLWSEDGRRIVLSLIVGTQDVRRAHSDEARDVLRDRAWWLRNKAAELGHGLPYAPIDLGSDKELPGDYEAGHAGGWAYEASAMPDDAALTDHLGFACGALFAVVDDLGLAPVGAG